MKFLAKLILAASLVFQTPLHAQTAPAANMVQLVDEYLAHVKSAQTGPVFLPVGRQEYLAKAVVAHLASQQTEDFNLFQFYLLDRYVKKIEERPYLFSLMQLLRDHLKDELATTELVRQGPGENIKQSIYSYWIWIALTIGVSWRIMLNRSTALNERVMHINQSIAERGRIYNMPYRIVVNPLTTAMVPATAWGYFQYFMESQKAHKVDPGEVLKVVQAQLACHLSYRGLELQDRYESLAGKPQELQAAAESMRKDAGAVVQQATLLSEQYPYLQNIRLKDRFFAASLERFPKSDSWKQFRDVLNSTDADQPGTCRQLALEFLISEMKSLTDKLPEAAPAAPQPAETSPP